nr:MAG TPA: hypothetical protein [Caudoviricetes sp.]
MRDVNKKSLKKREGFKMLTRAEVRKDTRNA